MRVLYSFPHKLGAPGVGTTAYQQVLGLHEQGVELTVVCPRPVAPLPREVRLIESLRLGPVHLRPRILGRKRAYDWHDAVVAALLEEGRASYALVHAWPPACLRTLHRAREVGVPGLREAPSPHSAAAMASAAQAARDVGVPLPAEHHHNRGSSFLAREEAEYAAASHILAPSDYARGTFIERGFPASTVLQHRYGFDPLRFARPPSVPSSFSAIFVGRGEPNKGLHYAVEAFNRAGSPGRLLVVGDLMPTYLQYLQRNFNLDKVVFRPFRQSVSEEMRGATALLLPSYTEGSALVSYEAQASGCVPLVSDRSGAVGVHLQHSLGDIDALTAQIRRLCSDQEFYLETRRRMLSGRAELTWSSAAQVLLERYVQAIDDR